MQPSFEVADVLAQVDFSDARFTVHQQKTLRALGACRTAELGGHIDACDSCGNVSISYNSCRNRHCPKCQGHKREEWIRAREQELLPCSSTTMWYSPYHRSFMVWHYINRNWFTKPCLMLSGPRLISSAKMNNCNWV